MDGIPDELKARKQWGLWRYEGGVKTPFFIFVNVRGREREKKAKSNDSKTWMTFSDASKHVIDYDGLCYFFDLDDPYIGIDIDDCIVSGHLLTEVARDILDQGETYTEISPSKRGLKLWVKGESPIPEDKTGWNAKGVEIYHDRRFFCVTGDVWDGLDQIRTQQKLIDFVYETHFKDRSKERSPLSDNADAIDDDGVEDAAYHFLEKNAIAISGQRGHDQLFKACCAVWEFGLTEERATQLIDEYNDRCEPPFDQKEVDRKLRQAYEKVTSENRFGSKEAAQRFYDRESDGSEFDDVKSSETSLTIPISIDQWIADYDAGKTPDVLENDIDLPIVKGWCTILGAPPAMGKTTLAVQLATSFFFTRENSKVLYLSTEMSGVSLVEKQISILSGVDAETLFWHKDKLTKDQRAKVDPWKQRIHMEQHRFHQMKEITVREDEIQKMAEQYLPDLIVIDYMQHVSMQVDDRRLAMEDLIRTIRGICGSLDIAILAISALSCEGKFRNASEIEYGADNAYRMVRDKETGITTLKCEKMRFSKDRDFELTQDKSLRFHLASRPGDEFKDVTEDTKDASSDEKTVTDDARKRRRRRRAKAAEGRSDKDDPLDATA